MKISLVRARFTAFNPLMRHDGSYLFSVTVADFDTRRLKSPLGEAGYAVQQHALMLMDCLGKSSCSISTKNC